MTEAERWLEQARRDLDDARYAAAGARWNLACFLAQQAAEKALKGFLYARGAEAVSGHSVAELCDEAAAHDRAFADLQAEAAALDQYYIPTRYPNGLPGGVPAEVFSERQAAEAVSLARRFLALARAALG